MKYLINLDGLTSHHVEISLRNVLFIFNYGEDLICTLLNKIKLLRMRVANHPLHLGTDKENLSCKTAQG